MNEFSNYDMAVIAAFILRHLTSDRCAVLKTSERVWRVARYDPSGKEVEW
jgi:hypothetical protein